MQAYREPHVGAPLVTMIADTILALDAETGALLWKQRVERSVTRIVVTGALVFVAADEEQVTTVFLLDLATGAPKGSIALPFHCKAALVSGDRVYFSGGKGILAMRNDGRVMFQTTPQIMKKSAWDGDTVDLVGHGPTGREMWRLPKVGYSRVTYLSVGSDVAQIDIDG